MMRSIFKLTNIKLVNANTIQTSPIYINKQDKSNQCTKHWTNHRNVWFNRLWWHRHKSIWVHIKKYIYNLITINIYLLIINLIWLMNITRPYYHACFPISSLSKLVFLKWQTDQSKYHCNAYKTPYEFRWNTIQFFKTLFVPIFCF